MECLKDGYQMIKVPYVKKFVKVVGLGMRAVSEGRNVRSVSCSRIRMCRSQGQKAVGWLWPLWWDKDSSASGAISQWGKPFLPHDGQGRSKPLQSQCCLSQPFLKPLDIPGVFIWAPDFCPFPPAPTCCCRDWRGSLCSCGWASGPSDLLSRLSKTQTITEGEQLCVTAQHEPQHKDRLSLWAPG